MVKPRHDYVGQRGEGGDVLSSGDLSVTEDGASGLAHIVKVRLVLAEERVGKVLSFGLLIRFITLDQHAMVCSVEVGLDRHTQVAVNNRLVQELLVDFVCVSYLHRHKQASFFGRKQVWIVEANELVDGKFEVGNLVLRKHAPHFGVCALNGSINICALDLDGL